MKHGFRTAFVATSIALGSLFAVAGSTAPASAATVVVQTGSNYHHSHYRHHDRYYRHHHRRHYRQCWTKTRRVYTHHGHYRLVKKRYCRY